ncbi:hypothetical protein E2I00_001232 [Balaenoptera physalus]|uniref:Protein transport protein Sec61 subunit gamma n=1 Tax=Balaenoptera physalus TaxID=9770 RepID=A0A643C170_BALPH|nr:hypothetical protein E2I00_001232 [Balaenoptera physalus]
MYEEMHFTLNISEISVQGIMDQVMQFVEPSRQFVKDSIRLVKRCTKPDRKVIFNDFRVFSIFHISTLENLLELFLRCHSLPKPPPSKKSLNVKSTAYCSDNAKNNVNFVFLNPEFQKIAMATAIGFAIMGFIGFFVKLIHIPINNIIV